MGFEPKGMDAEWFQLICLAKQSCSTLLCAPVYQSHHLQFTKICHLFQGLELMRAVALHYSLRQFAIL